MKQPLFPSLLCSAILWLPALVHAAEPLQLALDPARFQALVAASSNQVVLVFTESREFPVRSTEGIPARLMPQAEAKPSFTGSARPGEFYVFQIAVYALREVGPLQVKFHPLKGRADTIPARSLRCLSLGGTNNMGDYFQKRISVEAGALQVLWVGVDVPRTARESYSGAVDVRLNRETTIPVQLTLKVSGVAVNDHGDSVAGNLSRLRWLDSTAGGEDILTQPFTPVRTGRRTINVLGRELELGSDGLPVQIRSFFSPANTTVQKKGRELMVAPLQFKIEAEDGVVAWKSKFQRLAGTETEARWTARMVDGKHDLRADVTGRLDYTGSGEIRIRLTAGSDIRLKDLALDLPLREDVARYFMGLGHPGGARPAEVNWQWDVKKRQDCFWVGDVNAGLMLRFKDAEYLRPPVNIYYGFRPLLLPKSWGNAGQGGITVETRADRHVSARAYSGPRWIQKGETLDFIFEMYLTPFRTIDTEKQWSVRFTHLGGPGRDPIDEAVKSADARLGPNVVNVHHGSFYSPYINYPYSDESFGPLCDLVKRAHEKGVKLRVYYTTREITQNMPELFPLHQFNGEIILPGPGREARTLLHPKGPHTWLSENLRTNFIPAWEAQVGAPYAELDLSVITTPDSRWNNFYLEGLQWLIDKSDFDGMYIDDTALDAVSLRRARRLLDSRPGRLIDLHTWNHFNGWAGFANNLTIYMEILPYLDRLWLGEGFNASEVTPEFWLVEMSGLPFGLMSEMLDGANPWRGLVFGETARHPWSGDPRAIWKAWDEQGMAGTEFIPFFVRDCPVKTDQSGVMATVYRKEGRVLIALGSWEKESKDVTLTIDWKALGLDSKSATLFAPAIQGFQEERHFSPGDRIPVAPGRGWFLVVK